jgi:hypothetical protein
MWEPRRLITVWAFTACYRDSFTFIWLPNFFGVQSHYSNPLWISIRKIIIISPVFLSLILMFVLLLFLLLLLLIYLFVHSWRYLQWTSLCASRYPVWPMWSSVVAASSLSRCSVACHRSGKCLTVMLKLRTEGNTGLHVKCGKYFTDCNRTLNS